MTDLRSKANAPRGGSTAERNPPEVMRERLATISRDDGSDLCVSWVSFDGKPALLIQRWKPGPGGLSPDRECRVTVELNELPKLAEGVARALRKADAHERGRR